VKLPEGVEKSVKTKPNGKTYTYYYWNPGRGTKRQAERIKLPNPEKQPRLFWAEVERRQTSTPTAYPAGSIGDLIARYRDSDEFKRLSEGTKSNYEVHMRRFEDCDGWGTLAVRGLEPIVVQMLRDSTKETPVMANQMLSVGGTIWDWAIPLNLAKLNPFEKVRDFEVPDRGHVPWPAWAIEHVRQRAWPDLLRMMRLGIMTCQRGSDMVEMGPEHRNGHGLLSRPKKTKKRRRAFMIPLTTADALELDRWAETPVTFTNSRWKQPIQRFREDLYLYSPKGAQYTPTACARAMGDGSPIRPKASSSASVGRSGSPVRSKNTSGTSTPRTPIIRPSTACEALASWSAPSKGYGVDQIANDIGMTRQNVEQYMRFRDQMKVAADGKKRLRLVTKED